MASPCRPRRKRSRSPRRNCRSRRASSRASRNREVVMAEMKTADIRAMSPDQQDDAILNLKKERFNLRFQRATGQLENTSRLREARRDIARIKTVAAQTRAKKKQEAYEDAETYFAGRGRQRQASQDHRGARRSPLHAPDLQEDDPPFEELPRARREQRVQAGRHGVDRGIEADFEVEALGRDPGRTQEKRLICWL